MESDVGAEKVDGISSSVVACVDERDVVDVVGDTGDGLMGGSWKGEGKDRAIDEREEWDNTEARGEVSGVKNSSSSLSEGDGDVWKR